MPRYTAKTYGKKGGLDPKADRQFDELLIETRTTRRGTIRVSPSPSPKKQHSPTKQPSKAPVSPRPTRRTASEMSVESFDSPKRRRIASGNEDPFSFSSDDENPRSPTRRPSATRSTEAEALHLVIPSSPNADETKRQTRGSIAQWEAENKIQTRSSGSPLSPGGLPSSLSHSPKKQTSATVNKHSKRALFNNADMEVENTSQVNSFGSKDNNELRVQRTSRYDVGKRNVGQNASKATERKSAPSSADSSPPSSPPGSPTTRSRASRTNNAKSQNNVENSRPHNAVNSSSPAKASTLQTSVAKLALETKSGASKSSRSQNPSAPAKPSSLTKDEFDFTDSEDEEESQGKDNGKGAEAADAVPKRIFNSPKKVSCDSHCLLLVPIWCFINNTSCTGCQKKRMV